MHQPNLDNFKKKLHDLLIEKDGNPSAEDILPYKQQANEQGFGERGLNKLLQELSSNINWDHIFNERALRKAEIENRIARINDASEILKLIVKHSSSDGIFEIEEIRNYFNTAAQLEQDEKIIAKSLNNYFEANSYSPVDIPSGKTLRLFLESTEWRKDYVKQRSDAVVESKITNKAEPGYYEPEPLIDEGDLQPDLNLDNFDIYYQEEFRMIIESNENYKGKWNWYAFFFSWMWCLTKGCWAVGIIIFVCLLVTYDTGFHYFVWVAAALLTGFRGNWLYYNAQVNHSQLPKML